MRTAFLGASTWRDFIRSAAGYANDGRHNGNPPPPESSASQNIAYADTHRHKHWRLTNASSSDDAPAKDPPFVHNQTKIELMRTALGAPQSLMTLSHMTWFGLITWWATLPMRASARFTKANLNGDAGENLPRARLQVAGIMDRDSVFGAGRAALHRPLVCLCQRSNSTPS